MATTEEKIALIIEAVNKFKSTFDELQRGLNEIDSGHQKIAQKSDSVFKKLKENWVAISVAVYEVIKVVKEAWEFMEAGAKAEQAEDSFRKVAAAASESADGILEAMRRAANGTMDDSAIMQKAVKGMIQGLSGDQMVHIMEAARVSARVAGVDVQQAYEDITNAIANKMPRALRQYGLVTQDQMKLLDASMAAGISKVDLYALAMANAADQLKKFGEVQDTNAEKLQQWKALWEEIKETIGKAIFWLMDNALNPLVAWVETLGTVFARVFGRIGALWDWMKSIISGVWNWIKSGFKGSIIDVFSNATNDLIKQDAILDKAFDEQMAEIVQRYRKRAGELPAGKPTSKPATPGKSSKELEDQMKADLASKMREAEIERQIANIDIAEKERTISQVAAAQKRVDLAEQLLRTQEANLALIDKEAVGGAQAWAAQQKAIDETKKKLSDFRLAMRDLSNDFSGGFIEGLKQFQEQIGSVFQRAVELAKSTAQAMQQAFSDFFFDIMTGKFKSLWDYVMNFLQAIARAVANYMSQSIVQSIIPSIFPSASLPGGTTMAGGYPVAHAGGLVMHGGGYVPRFHIGGLSSDEVPAILQKGEYVVSRKGVAALDRINKGDAGGVNVVVNVENKSSQAVDAKSTGTRFDGKQYVVGVVLTDIEQGGPIRNAITGLRR